MMGPFGFVRRTAGAERSQFRGMVPAPNEPNPGTRLPRRTNPSRDRDRAPGAPSKAKVQVMCGPDRHRSPGGPRSGGRGDERSQSAVAVPGAERTQSGVLRDGTNPIRRRAEQSQSARRPRAERSQCPPPAGDLGIGFVRRDDPGRPPRRVRSAPGRLGSVGAIVDPVSLLGVARPLAFPSFGMSKSHPISSQSARPAFSESGAGGDPTGMGGLLRILPRLRAPASSGGGAAGGDVLNRRPRPPPRRTTICRGSRAGARG